MCPSRCCSPSPGSTVIGMTHPLPHEEPAPPSLTELLELQGGVVSCRQALDGRLTAEAWRWLRTAKRCQQLLPGVVVMHTGTATYAEKVQSAVLYGGEGAAVSGDALLHLLEPKRSREPELIDVAVAVSCQIAATEFFRPHRISRLEVLAHPVRLPRQIRAAPGVLHAASWARSDRAAEWRVAAAVQSWLVNVPGLREALVQLPRLKRRQAIRLVLDDVELGAHARTELDFLALLRRNSLPLPDRLQLKVRADGVRYLDAWWEAQRVVAEIDGVHHMFVRAWDDDTMRANAVVVAHLADRVVLLRITSGNMRHREPELAAQLRAVLV